MTKHNTENERIKHRYRVWLQDARGYSETSIDQALSAITEFESHTRCRPFRLFHIESARAFTRDLCARRNPKTGKPYSKATLNGTLGSLRKFVEWLGGQPECRRRIRYGDAAYFRLTEKDGRIARATRPKRVPTVDEVRRVIAAMPTETEVEKRNRAVIAFVLLTCARVSAVASARLKHVDLAEGAFHQDARDVRTKRSKTFSTWFFPVGDDVQEVVADWTRFLVEERGFGPDDPLFPKTLLTHDDNLRYIAAGLSRACWVTAEPIRDIFREAFRAVGLPPLHPHLLRDTIAQLGQRKCRTPEEFKAWSQNMGHDHVLTTLTSYGTVAAQRQAEILRGLAPTARPSSNPVDPELDPDTVRRVLDHLRTSVQLH